MIVMMILIRMIMMITINNMIIMIRRIIISTLKISSFSIEISEHRYLNNCHTNLLVQHLPWNNHHQTSYLVHCFGDKTFLSCPFRPFLFSGPIHFWIRIFIIFALILELLLKYPFINHLHHNLLKQACKPQSYVNLKLCPLAKCSADSLQSVNIGVAKDIIWSNGLSDPNFQMICFTFYLDWHLLWNRVGCIVLRHNFWNQLSSSKEPLE